jgi:hypothetical protein
LAQISIAFALAGALPFWHPYTMQPAFLNVEASLTGQRWVGPDPAQDRLAEAMAQETRLPLPLCRVLVARGIMPGDAEAFLAPTLKELLPDPRSLLDMERAARRFLTALDQPIMTSMAGLLRRCCWCGCAPWGTRPRSIFPIGSMKAMAPMYRRCRHWPPTTA